MPSERKQELLKLFQGWYPAIPALIQAAPQDAILRNDIYDRPPLIAWSQGRVTLLGDAAHPMTPNLGQGTGCLTDRAWSYTDCHAERLRGLCERFPQGSDRWLEGALT